MSPRGSMQHGRRARVLAWPDRGRGIEGASDRSYPPHAPATPKASPPKEREQKDDEPRDAQDVRMSVCDRLAQHELERCDSALHRRRRDAAPRRVAHKLGEQHDLGPPLPAAGPVWGARIPPPLARSASVTHPDASKDEERRRATEENRQNRRRRRTCLTRSAASQKPG
jgi:hypothetical protein